MSTKETGGPAFPSSPAIGPNDQLYRPVDIGCEGVSTRDYFAAKALQGAMTRESFADGFDFREKAVWVYAMADAMLEARK